MFVKKGILISSLLILVGCQTTPEPKQTKPQATQEKPVQKGIPTPDGVKITPYDQGEISKQSLPKPSKPAPPKVIVPKQQVAQQHVDDGTSLVPYRNTIAEANKALKAAKWDDAEKHALQAQRLAPQAAEPFLYLALISEHRNQNTNAESLARRGLSYAQTPPMKRELWKVILNSATKQKNTKVVAEAQSHLKAL